MSDRALMLYRKAEAAAESGNTRFADALARLDRINQRLIGLDGERERVRQEYEALERALLKEAEELE